MIFVFDCNEGCVWWIYEVEVEVCSLLIVVDGDDGFFQMFYFGDFEGSVYVIDVNIGEEVWKCDVLDYKDVMIIGLVVYYDG